MIIFDDYVSKFIERKTLRNYMDDLTCEVNYGLDKDKMIFKENVNIYESSYNDITMTLPAKFRYVYTRKTLYIKSKNSIHKKKVLIFRDSSTSLLIPFPSISVP